MDMDTLINLIATNGMSIVIIAYMLYKDFKFNQLILDVLTEVKEVLIEIKTVQRTQHDAK